jgi:hypothetical protein
MDSSGCAAPNAFRACEDDRRGTGAVECGLTAQNVVSVQPIFFGHEGELRETRLKGEGIVEHQVRVRFPVELARPNVGVKWQDFCRFTGQSRWQTHEFETAARAGLRRSLVRFRAAFRDRFRLR